MRNVTKNIYLLPGTIALKRNGKIVWWGHVCAPWEDVECDSMEVSERDYEELKNRTQHASRKL
jgi:hypothetical protein